MNGAYDAIIVGARCAGSPTAMLLAQKGYRVLLVDKATFPSNMPLSTHVVQAPALARLQRWGLLDQVIASGCPPLETYEFDFGPFAIAGPPKPLNGSGHAYAPRRFVLDDILVKAATAAGAELREGFHVDDVLHDDGRVVGIEGHARRGGQVRERAHVVIGTDGMNSFVARAVQAPKYNTKPKLQGAVFSYWSGVQAQKFEVHVGDQQVTFAIPTNDGLTLVASAWPARDLPSARDNLEAKYLSTLRAVNPDLYERTLAGRREEGFILGATANYFRKPHGPGWALAGDAGYLKDPVTASGITDAFRDAELLAEAVDAGLSGRQELETALAGFEARRNEQSAAMYEFTTQLATQEPPPPEMQQLLSAVARVPEASSAFLGVVAQTVPVQEFFAPANVERVMAAASAP
ncbi:MAG TPA: FAD-dependent oxidoreductase [Chloroflexota bacterium]|jgi:flavin-dependent dehydrogenase